MLTEQQLLGMDVFPSDLSSRSRAVRSRAESVSLGLVYPCLLTAVPVTVTVAHPLMHFFVSK